jgi:hypothetical protein
MPTSVSSPPEQPAGPPPGHFSEPAPNSIDRWYKATGWVTATNIFSGLEHVSGPPSRFFLDAEFLLSWIKDSRVPALVTKGSPRDPLIGALGQPGTVVLFGGVVDNEERSGGRFTAGYWLDCGHTVGLEAVSFFLGKRSVPFTASSSASSQSPFLARPFFNIRAGVEDVDNVAAPGFQAGTIAFDLSSRLVGAEANARVNQDLNGPCSKVSFLGGFRYMNLDENLAIDEAAALVPVGRANQGFVADRFDTASRFYGGQFGVGTTFLRDRWHLDMQGKVAFGLTDEVIDIFGATRITQPSGRSVVFPAGFLALPTNTGHFTRDRFTVVPEVDFALSCQVNDHLRVHVGYNFLYWSRVVRPGNQIDRVINITQLPSSQGPGFVTSPFRPVFAFQGTDFWAQGIDMGLEIDF